MLAFLACLSVMMPLEVERMAMPSPPRTLGILSTFEYVLRPGRETLWRPVMTLLFLSAYLSVMRMVP